MRVFMFVLALGLSACAQPRPSSPPSAVEHYVDLLAAVEQSNSPVSMAPLFAAAGAAQDQLMAIQEGSDQAWQETLGDAEYATLREQLRGLHLSRGHDVYAQPDGAFFSALAQAHGDDADRAFFALYAKLWTADEMLPQYLRLGSGQAPCVRFGDGIVAPLYRDWRAYAAAHPQAYAAFTTQTLRDLEEVVELGTCACGDVASVQRELDGFIEQFPDSAALPKARLRLAELNRSDIDHFVQCR